MTQAIQARDYHAMISDRAHSIDVSGIRRAFEIGAKLDDPINLSIGQPDFDVPDAIRNAAHAAIDAGRNGYTLTQGAADLRASITSHLKEDLGWDVTGRAGLDMFVTSGTSGALLLACMALLNPGDEIVIPDPYFVIYPALATVTGAKAVCCDTYPDMRMTAERVAPLLTDKTKLVLVNSPGNPSGVVLSQREMDDLAALCRERGVVLLSDEIYDAFTYADAREDGHCPSPARTHDDVLLVRGFGKTYGCTGWRLGYAAGPSAIVEQMKKLQQYTFVCAPSVLQAGCAEAFGVDMEPRIEAYRRRRDMVVEALSPYTNVAAAGGAFYAWVEVPAHLNMSAQDFCDRAIDDSVIVIPGNVFSERDTHFRISYATPEDRLAEGLRRLARLLAP